MGVLLFWNFAAIAVTQGDGVAVDTEAGARFDQEEVVAYAQACDT